MNKLEIILKHVILKKYLKSKISGKLFLKKNPNEIKKIGILYKKLFDIEYNFDEKLLSNYIFLNKSNALIVLKNKLKNIFFTNSNRVSYCFLNQFYSTFARKKYFTKFFLPMCDEQIKFIKANTDIKLSIWKCKLLFLILTLRHLSMGFIFGLKSLLLSLIHIIFKRTKKPTSRHIFFDVEMTKEDIANLKSGDDLFIVKKFLKKFRVNKNIIINIKPKNKKINFYKNKIDYSGYSFYFKNNPYPNIEKVSNFFKYLFWFNLSFLICVKDLLFFKNWLNSFLFFEAVKSKLFQYSEKDQIPYIIIVPYNGSINRSLWTLDFKKNIKRSYMFFYSTNGDGYKTKFHNPNNVSNWWGELDYEHFLVWDKYQANTLKKYLKVKKPKVITIGPMLSSCSETNDMINLTKKFIVIFDIVPERFSYNFFISYSIIKPKHIINFQNDILKIASELNVVVLHKIKRRRSDTIVSKSYIKNILNLKKFNNYKQINENQSIETLVKKSKGVISFPYTSTSLIAKYMKTPTVYYDSSKSLIDIEEKIQSHGIKIINNVEELRVWMKNAIK